MEDRTKATRNKKVEDLEENGRERMREENKGKI